MAGSVHSLAGKCGFVTGSSRGIGRGCALEMAAAGADVAINYHSNQAEAESLANEIRGMGRRTLVLQGDVGQRQRVEEMIAETAATFGRLDLFVSNAVYSEREFLLDADMDGFEKTVNVSMWGAFYGLRAAAQQMVRQGQGGSIVIVSSPHAVIPIPGTMAYNMAKAAIDHMARTAAIELAEHRIRVNLLHPGWIDTPGERKFFTEEQLAEGAKKLPWKRLGNINEIGRGVVYMLSDAADYMTGSTLLLDGGVSLPWWSNRKEGQQ